MGIVQAKYKDNKGGVQLKTGPHRYSEACLFSFQRRINFYFYECRPKHWLDTGTMRFHITRCSVFFVSHCNHHYAHNSCTMPV